MQEASERGDAYGGERANRMRFALEITEAVRAAWDECVADDSSAAPPNGALWCWAPCKTRNP